VKTGFANFFVLENITKDYDGFPVLKDINVRIRQEEFICIVGNSGSGKSTLLKIMGGIEPFTSGNIYLRDVPRKGRHTPDEQRHFGIVFQQDRLMEWRTVFQNVRFPLEVFKLKKPGYVSGIEDVLRRVGLLRFKNLYPIELSGGMRMRAAIARALVHDPDILFFDQPFDAVDAITQKTLEFDILRLWNESKKTVVMITNSLDQALLLGSRILVLAGSPASICYETAVDIPMQDRLGNIYNSNYYIRLKEKLVSVLQNEKELYASA
jgi:NitT/TauT family transport system ATP-binding protein